MCLGDSWEMMSGYTQSEYKRCAVSPACRQRQPTRSRETPVAAGKTRTSRISSLQCRCWRAELQCWCGQAHSGCHRRPAHHMQPSTTLDNKHYTEVRPGRSILGGVQSCRHVRQAGNKDTTGPPMWCNTKAKTPTDVCAGDCARAAACRPTHTAHQTSATHRMKHSHTRTRRHTTRARAGAAVHCHCFRPPGVPEGLGSVLCAVSRKQHAAGRHAADGTPGHACRAGPLYTQLCP